jgi:hypothetical protein
MLMLPVKRNQSESQPELKKLNVRWEVLFKDLSLLCSLWFAHLLVWRALRQRRREHDARRKRFRLIQGTQKAGDIIVAFKKQF